MIYRNRKEGAALILVLIVLLLGSLLLLTSMEMTENLFSTSQATKKHVDLYSAAQHGQELGKSWIAENVANERIPSGSEPSDTDADDIMEAGTLEDVDNHNVDVFFPDLVVSADSEYALFSRSLSDNIDLYVVVYDAVKMPSGVDFGPSHEAPPRMNDREASIGQGSAKQGQTYSGSNRGGTGGITEDSAFVELPAYVIRSLATYEDRNFGIEGGYRLEP